jgi:hypothetical protein
MEVEEEQEQRQLAPERDTQGLERARRSSSRKHRGRMAHMGRELETKIEAKIWLKEAKEQVMGQLSQTARWQRITSLRWMVKQPSTRRRWKTSIDSLRCRKRQHLARSARHSKVAQEEVLKYTQSSVMATSRQDPI